MLRPRILVLIRLALLLVAHQVEGARVEVERLGELVSRLVLQLVRQVDFNVGELLGAVELRLGHGGALQGGLRPAVLAVALRATLISPATRVEDLRPLVIPCS